MLTQNCCCDTVNVEVSTGRVDVVLHDVGRRAPLLVTELVVTPDNADFCYSTPVDTIASRVIAIFDRAITKLQVRQAAWLQHPTLHRVACWLQPGQLS